MTQYMRVLVTGSCGLIGSEAVSHYAEQGHEVLGVDNNLRSYFFGPAADTLPVLNELRSVYSSYRHESVDIRDREAVVRIFAEFQPEFIIHAASQPSHDWAAREPFTDFEVNAVATLNLLEATRQHCPQAVFAFLSTNKVYGDGPNHVAMQELPLRFEYQGEFFKKGIPETFSIDHCLHSLFGASKVAADVLVQEYGRYFSMKTAAFRGGCLTGSRHRGVELHGFLSYFVACAVKKQPYTIIGYQGKQVRDQIHSADVIQALDCFRRNPRCGEAYNLGGGFENSASILELLEILKKDFGIEMQTRYSDNARKGDHICYYSDLTKFRAHYPEFALTRSLPSILEEMIQRASQGTKKAA